VKRRTKGKKKKKGKEKLNSNKLTYIFNCSYVGSQPHEERFETPMKSEKPSREQVEEVFRMREQFLFRGL
jgi:hypothetical protein